MQYKELYLTHTRILTWHIKLGSEPSTAKVSPSPLTVMYQKRVQISGPKFRCAYFTIISISVLSHHLAAWQKFDVCPQSPQNSVTLLLPSGQHASPGLYHVT